MAGYFLDTSALAKHYHHETGTARVDALLAEAGARHFISRFGAVELLAAHFQEAERLLLQYGPAQSIRTLDALQLAVALDLRGRGLIDYFVCADRRLLAVATVEGVPVIDPEQP